jgi:hypothetical protein
MERVHISVHLTTPADIYAIFLTSSMRQDHILVPFIKTTQQSTPTPIYIGHFSHFFVEPRKQVFRNPAAKFG